MATMGCGRGGVPVGGGRADGGDAKVDGCGVAGAMVELGELVVGAGEADLEAFDLAQPAFAFGLCDPGGQVGWGLARASGI